MVFGDWTPLAKSKWLIYPNSVFGLLLKVLIQLQPSWWESFPEFLVVLDQAFGGRNVESLWYRSGAGGKEL